jgi:hypothetical protein
MSFLAAARLTVAGELQGPMHPCIGTDVPSPPREVPSSFFIAKRMPESLRTSATTAFFFPLRAAMPCAHARRCSVSARGCQSHFIPERAPSSSSRFSWGSFLWGQRRRRKSVWMASESSVTRIRRLLTCWSIARNDCQDHHPPANPGPAINVLEPELAGLAASLSLSGTQQPI